MSFQDGVILNGAIGSTLAGLGWGKDKVVNFFSKNKPSDFTRLRQQLEMRNAVRGNNTFQTLRNSWRWNDLMKYESKMPRAVSYTPEQFAQLKPKLQQRVRIQGRQARHYKKARALLAEAKTLKGAAQAQKIKEFKQAFANARLASYKAKYTGCLRPTSFLGKTKNAIKTATGVRAANTTLKTINAASPALRTAGKFVKGNAAFAALSVAADYDKFAAAKQVGGNKAMTKEIAKSTGVAAVEAVGFWAGMKAGAAIGTAVGTAFPGVGNVVGGIAGAIIGGLASWGLGSLAHNALGCDKSEAEKITTKNARLLALKAKYNKETREDLVLTSAEILRKDTKALQNAEANNTELNISPVVMERYENAMASLNNIAENDPELFDKLEHELEQAEQEFSEQEVPDSGGESNLPDNNDSIASDSTNTSALAATMNKFSERIDSIGASSNYSPPPQTGFQYPWLDNPW